MSDYRVDVSEHASRQIRGYAHRIEKVSASWRIAERWVDRVYDAIGTLRYMPDRYDLAAEGRYCSYEVRRLLIGDYLAAYHVDESSHVVTVLSFRHGSRLPRPSDLPDDPQAPTG